MIKILEWESIKIEGIMQGAFWMPYGATYTKQFNEKFTREQKPFSHEWTGLRDALLRITNDGDSSINDIILDCSMTIIYRNLMTNTRIQRIVEIPIGKEVADLFYKDADEKERVLSLALEVE